MSNRLADETSPYLRQHADNPVDWWPWCDEALAAAREADRPILLSIGYAACHWCHVMAHESFEDEDTAARMNAGFVNIKVDREERPDLDQVYQLAHQILTRRPGGWPLTVVLDPHTLAPFMAGTYFPGEAAHGLPAFRDVLTQVAEWYAGNSHKLRDQKARLDEIFDRLTPEPAATPPASDALDHAAEALAASFDAEHGGFTGAPKFPHPGSLALARRLAARGGGTGEMARFTLRGMAAGGLFDHLGGGFFRYCVDERWEIPHFEKMLYDNGALLALYAPAAAESGDLLMHRAAAATADWALAELRSPEGGFYASLDADSGGVEGGYYVWDAAEVRDALGGDFDAFAARFGLDGPPNFRADGAERWHLRLGRDAADEEPAAIARARESLLQIRHTRPRPGLAHKRLTAWNALMAEGLLAAGRHLGRADATRAARECLDFVRDALWDGRRLRAVYDGEHARIGGYLDDHALVLRALLAALEDEWRDADLAWALTLADTLLSDFEDGERGGFYLTAHDHETLLHRPKPLADESTPAGNGVAAHALLHLGWLTGEPRYLRAAERTLCLAAEPMRQYPMAHAGLLAALADYHEPPEIVILRGEPGAMATARERLAMDGSAVYAIPADADLPPALAAKTPRGEVVAYRCRGMTCSEPITAFE